MSVQLYIVMFLINAYINTSLPKQYCTCCFFLLCNRHSTISSNITRSIPLGGNLGITNDLALVAEDQFYITIMAVFHFLPLLAIVETFLPLRTGSVFFYNGTEMQKIIPSLNNPNGVFLSPDHRWVEQTMYF